MRLLGPAPRLLPLTVVAMAGLLAIKCVGLSGAVAPAAARAPDAAWGPAANPPLPAPVPTPAPMPAAPVPAALVPAALVPAALVPAALVPAAPSPAAPAPATPAGETTTVSASERALLLELRKRRGDLDARESALSLRESVAAAAEHRMAARLDELADLQRRLEALDAARRNRDEEGWRGLVRVYETMKAKDAALIFNDLDMPVLLQVADRMKEAKAASVIAAMQPDRARLLTAALAKSRTHANEVMPPSTTPPAAH